MGLVRSSIAALGLLSACGPSAGESLLIDFGPVALGTTQSLSRGLTQPITQFEVSHPDLSARVTATGARLELTYRPLTPGPMQAVVELTSASGTEVWSVRGEGALPEVEVFPEILSVPAQGSADLWVWLPPGLTVGLVSDSPLGPCPGMPCVQVVSGGVDRGLPATVRVYGPLEGPTSLALSTCPHPSCRVEVPAQPQLGCGPLIIAAAPVGQASLRSLACEGPDSGTSPHPELSVVDTSTSGITAQWTPTRAGPFEAEITRGAERIVVRGYAVDAPVCRAELGPNPVVFGAVGLGAFAEQDLSVTSLGPEPCLVSGAQINGRGFSASPTPPRWLEPGAQDSLRLRFSPRTPGRHLGLAQLWLSDGSEGAQVELAGHGVVSDLELLTLSLDFGEVSTCAGLTRPVRILNRGSLPGLIVDASLSGEAADLVQGRWPARVPAGDLLSVPVRLSPNRSGLLQAALRLELEDSRARATYEVPITARVPQDLGAVTEEFVQLGLPKADIVFVIDPVGAQSPSLRSLQANLQAIAQFTVAQGLGTSIAVVSAAASSTVAPGFEVRPGTERSVFSRGDPDFEEALVETALAVARRSPGANQAVANVYAALTSSAAAWVRPEAVLSIVAVSLQEDGSAEAAETWTDRLLRFKGFRNTNLFTYSAIAGDVPGGCDNGDFTAEAAPRHLWIAQHSGGIFQSVCGPDWSRAFEDLTTVAFGFKSRFFLSAQPIVETIEVTVNDVPVPATSATGIVQWTYDFATNSINFSPFAYPEPEARIVVSYRRVCA